MRSKKVKKLLASEQSKQLELASFPSESIKKTRTEKKQIVITKLDSTLVWDDLFLEVEFQLVPSKSYFSKIKAELWFDQEKTKVFLFDILHSFSSTNEFTLKATLDLQETPMGTHSIKVEMYEPWSITEKHNQTEKETKIEYTPETKKATLRRIPTIKKIEAEGIAIISADEKQLYQEMQETMKKELTSKREE